MLRAHCFDGVVCIPNCDKIVPGMMMAARAVNIPAIFVSGGPMKAGQPADGDADRPRHRLRGGRQASGRQDEPTRELHEIEQNACPTCGSCSGMFTANSHELPLRGAGPRAARQRHASWPPTRERDALFRRAAGAIVELVEKNIRPRDILTREAFENAFALDMAMGGCTNTVLHTLAIAIEAGVDFDLPTTRTRSPRACRTSARSRRAGTCHMEDVDRAGGISAILKTIAAAPASSTWTR